jgi:hypothetical protein
VFSAYTPYRNAYPRVWQTIANHKFNGKSSIKIIKVGRDSVHRHGSDHFFHEGDALFNGHHSFLGRSWSAHGWIETQGKRHMSLVMATCHFWERHIGKSLGKMGVCLNENLHVLVHGRVKDLSHREMSVFLHHCPYSNCLWAHAPFFFKPKSTPSI